MQEEEKNRLWVVLKLCAVHVIWSTMKASEYGGNKAKMLTGPTIESRELRTVTLIVTFGDLLSFGVGGINWFT